MSTLLNTLFNLHNGEDDKQKTLESVKSNITFTGANLWILACAILVASVGLNVNSTAVIIGAMLISPLMGPIVASGFALGMYDFDLLKRSLRNLFIATLAGLLVSSIYFFISPFKEVQSEILARTSPNIYDILIAFFGGLVGVIAVTRVEKGNPIPGVAIATALMPPLCTAGYGLATGNFKFFFGAIFLYGINCVFICIATYSIVKFLKYPAKEEVDKKHQKQVRYGISFVVILMLLPSIYFAYKLFVEQQYQQSVNNFIEREFIDKGNTIVYKKTNYNSRPKTIELAFLSKRFTKEEIDSLNTKLYAMSIPTTKLLIRQDSADRIQLLRNNILNEIKNKDIIVDEKDKKIQALENEITKNTFDGKQILQETKIIFPTIQSLSISNNTFYYSNDSTNNSTIFIYQAQNELTNDDKTKFENWLKKRLSLEKIELIKK
ncbi:DUF389 domain-containing protein [Ferruginibacter lapsinanis]|uniref:DUF389 domain-containing protein n=1 Tax=Ferruginibacter lapsinanis TaxID=563172 RepID=UPI001E52F793|nr:DUF389 domain-containing protein [Ferruginibacter lapsinanis]UEG50233.1 DUF389 domain-containing protein [Ferruginibacter lapsinanis]